MRRLLIVVALIAATFVSPARGQVISESKNFELVTSVTIGGISVGGQAVGDTYFVASWQTGLRSYDISDPENPVELDHLREVSHNENEDLATNGKILLLSQFNRADPVNQLAVIDVSDPKDMKVIATVPGAGSHTMECLYDCKWAYGSGSKQASDGIIVDLRNPKKPKLLDKLWSDVTGVPAHDVTEVRPGLVVTSSTPMFALDTTDPANPKILTKTPDNAPHTGHNNIWPRGGKDRFLLSASETSANGRCELYSDDDGRTLQVWDTRAWRRGGFKPAGTYTLDHSEGHPPVDALGVQGCSAHWAHEQPGFKDGGLVAMAAWSHGVRLLEVSGTGDIKEVGWFLKDVHGAVDVEWVSDRIVYVIEDGGGIGGFDVIRYTGKL
ncbi:MAG: LVIVD repeat-containing protein [Actinomycetota bacterium]